MLTFHPISLDDQQMAETYFKQKHYYSAKYSFGSNFVWRLVYRISYAESNGFLFVQSEFDKEAPYFLCPVGTGNLCAAVEELDEYCKANQLVTRLYAVSKADRAVLEEYFGDRIQFTYNRDESDYVYEREKLATLSGRKYHGKRNHISQFKRGEWHYEPMSEENIPLCREMHHQWCGENDCPGDARGSQAKKLECCAALQAFRHFTALGFRGGVLYQNDRVVAYTMGEELTDDTFVVHFEKAFAEVAGAYPTINQEFVLHEMERYQYVNREEDTGEEGLRKAKLSYYPVDIIEEYNAVLN